MSDSDIDDDFRKRFEESVKSMPPELREYYEAIKVADGLDIPAQARGFLQIMIEAMKYFKSVTKETGTLFEDMDYKFLVKHISKQIESEQRP